MKRHRRKIEAGTAHLGSVDPVMRRLIGKCLPLTTLKLQSNRFGALVNSILSQQISIHAARAIRSRLTDLVGRGGLTADALTWIPGDQLRAIGVSQVKASYIKDLARKLHSGELRLNTIGRFNDEQVIEQLVEVKGIGVWTAQMFLISSLGRLDIFPHQDYGVRAAIRRPLRTRRTTGQRNRFPESLNPGGPMPRSPAGTAGAAMNWKEGLSSPWQKSDGSRYGVVAPDARRRSWFSVSGEMRAPTTEMV